MDLFFAYHTKLSIEERQQQSARDYKHMHAYLNAVLRDLSTASLLLRVMVTQGGERFEALLFPMTDELAALVPLKHEHADQHGTAGVQADTHKEELLGNAHGHGHGVLRMGRALDCPLDGWDAWKAIGNPVACGTNLVTSTK